MTLGSDDLINIPASKANLFHSEGCSRNGATHEGDIGVWGGAASGVETHPSLQGAYTSTSEYGLQARHMQVGEWTANGIETEKY